MDTWDKLFYSGAIALFVLNFIFINVNFTSLHGFYRDQLTRGFLFRKGTDSSRNSGRRVKLSELNSPGSAAPYHLVNVTLNLQGSDDINLRGRGADFYIMSRHFVGGDRTEDPGEHELGFDRVAGLGRPQDGFRDPVG